MKSILALCAIALCFGCGGSLDTQMGGTWRGSAIYAIQGLTPLTVSTIIPGTVHGADVTYSGVCPDGSGALTLTGSETHASWSGVFSCPAIAFGGCGAVVFTYSSGAATLNAGGTILISGAGNGSGCGTDRPFTTSFSGSR